MSTYTVHAKRAGKYWELHIDGVGVTQSRNLGTDADEMIRSYVETMTDTPADSVDYDITPEVGGGLDAEAAEARRSASEVEEALRLSAARNRSAARNLQAAGLSGRDIAFILRITPQRVSQLLSRAKKAGSRAETIKKTHKGTQRKNAANRSREKSSA